MKSKNLTAIRSFSLFSYEKVPPKLYSDDKKKAIHHLPLPALNVSNHDTTGAKQSGRGFLSLFSGKP